jgi:hypothetical protein
MKIQARRWLRVRWPTNELLDICRSGDDSPSVAVDDLTRPRPAGNRGLKSGFIRQILSAQATFSGQRRPDDVRDAGNLSRSRSRTFSHAPCTVARRSCPASDVRFAASSDLAGRRAEPGNPLTVPGPFRRVSAKGYRCVCKRRGCVPASWASIRCVNTFIFRKQHVGFCPS